MKVKWIMCFITLSIVVALLNLAIVAFASKSDLLSLIMSNNPVVLIVVPFSSMVSSILITNAIAYRMKW